MRNIIGLAAIGLVLTACGSKSPGTTPKATFQAATSVAKSKDYDALWNLIAPSQQKQIDAQFQKLRSQKGYGGIYGMKEKDIEKCGSARDFMSLMLKSNSEVFDRMAKAEYEKSKIQKDHATVTYNKGDHGTATCNMVQVDGKWYLDMDMGG